MRAASRRRYAAVSLLALVLLTAGCTGGDDGDDPESGASSPTPATGEPSPSGSTSPTGEPSGEPSVAAPTTALLDWQDAGAIGRDTVTVGDPWTVTVPDSGAKASADDGKRTVTVAAGKGRRVNDAILDDDRLLVVAQDKQEARPQLLTLVDLGTGKRSVVRTPEPATGGPVAFHDGLVAYATNGPGGKYCVATYDVDGGRGEVGYCAPRRHGFSNLSISDEGIALMTFDAKRPVSCRSLVSMGEDGSTTPVRGVPSCSGWDVLLTADGGAVWSALPNEQQVERGDFYATTGDSVTELGPGTTGTLTWCGGSAYFVRDAQKDVDKARLLRWTPEGTLEIVYESPGEGEAFLAPPECSGDRITVTAYGEGGDERVWATVPG